MSDDGNVPVAVYQIAALRIGCPRDGCDGMLMGLHGSSLIVRADGLTADQVVTCEECGHPYRIPAIVQELGH